MADILFVPGAGVREPAFGKLLRTVRAGLGAVLPPPWQVHGCNWSAACGAELQNGNSIPAYVQCKAFGADSGAEDDEIVDWALLYDDPLIELRLYAAQSAGTAGLRLGQPPHALLPARAAFDANLSAVSASQGSVHAALRHAFDAVRGYDQYALAIDCCTALHGGDLNPARAAIARAVAASWTTELIATGQATPDACRRDAVVAQLFAALGGTAAQHKQLGVLLRRHVLAPLRLLARPFLRAGLHAFTAASRYQRNALFDLASPALGDILLYQAHGQRLRDRIAADVARIDRPVIVLAHSLGGIASIEWLLQQHRPQVRGVITAGSQAPYFHEIGALATLQRGAPLPAHMPPWLNFHDRNDLLSFIAYPVMKHAGQTSADARIQDEEVCSGQPFPAAHSAYWSSEEFWRIAGAFIGRCQP